jgi:iron complex transport system ATP-binding protein
VASTDFVQGAPEELVLSGAFERAFAAEGVTFDPERGTFSLSDGTGPPVELSGAGALAYWTGHALERWGYRLASGPAQLRVQAHGESDRPRWTVMTGAGAIDCASWADLERQMRGFD